VTVVGLITLLGVAYTALGGWLLFAGADLNTRLENDPAGGMAPVLQLLAGFMVVIGVAFIVQGVPGVLAGWGVLSRRSWGRILALIVAALAAPWGLAFLVISRGDVTFITLGAAQVLYGILAFAVLIRAGDEFSRPGG
jgi:hypothetical protein